jgi:phosphatidylserine/phosphatidylglycerophosphate/cardiolipin synthase-like enzyme
VKAEAQEFIDEVVAVARYLPRAVLHRLCHALEGLPPDAVPGEHAAIARTIAQPETRVAICRLLGMWRTKAPAVSPTSVAWALRAACSADEYRRTWQSLELVWTGPAPRATTLRRTDQALLDLISSARRSVILVTFAAYKIPNVAAALVRAAKRGVAITLVVESPEASAGKTTFGAIAALGDVLAEKSAVYVWPLDQRLRDATGRHGSLHVKCAIADDAVALISSANLTEHAHNLNMELGLLVRGGDMPGRVAEHLRQLILTGVLTPAKCS